MYYISYFLQKSFRKACTIWPCLCINRYANYLMVKLNVKYLLLVQPGAPVLTQ